MAQFSDHRGSFAQLLPEVYQTFESKLVPQNVRGSTSDDDEVPQPVKPKLKRVVSRKSTLTEADLLPSQSAPLRPSTANGPTLLSRSRSVSIEPSGLDALKARSRSVSVSAEEIKAAGGKRGGIAGNSRLFASEVEMRRKASSGTWARSASGSNITTTQPGKPSGLSVIGGKHRFILSMT